jgi:flagellar protein FliS
MSVKQTELSYRRAAVQNASSVGLIIILYDLLIQDLRQAMDAIDRRDIEGRATAIKHAFLVLQQLEGSLDHENGREAAENLSKFYAVMRARILQAHIKISSEILSEQVRLLLDVRHAWQQVDPANLATVASSVPSAGTVPAATSGQQTVAGVEGEAGTASWTA